MTKRGIWHVDADNEVNDGIRIVSMVLNQRMVAVLPADRLRRPFRRCKPTPGTPRRLQRGEEKPLKIHDHGPDAFRYFAKREVPWWRLEK